ncbi:hypothetical protein PHLGIDRAFT_123457 [Phlebiopsis gigantea 11061_1 CR5-6]|uniref:DUF6532 domain-containing protein n=1 Tax=Phlebiopsis gigantea (strain 11061_1 CR5-6) TaxID=745531 RepID=A0A0C3S1H9_PHLG1|nr:hypothetical protein PHLGIDRAFT_123457 [Phlebiopsis gigantea 11061_1 CR5-6]
MAVTDKESSDKAKKQYDTLKKKYDKMKKSLAQQPNAFSNSQEGDGSSEGDFESEEETTHGYKSPFVSKGVVLPNKPRQKLQRASERRTPVTGKVPPQPKPQTQSLPPPAVEPLPNRNQSPSLLLSHSSNHSSRASSSLSARLPYDRLLSVASNIPSHRSGSRSSASSSHTNMASSRASSPPLSEASEALLEGNLHSADSEAGAGIQTEGRPRTDSFTQPTTHYRAHRGTTPPLFEPLDEDAPPPFAPKGQPLASDYSKTIEGLINQAVDHVAVRIYTEQAFPLALEKDEWAQEAWLAITRRVSNIRSHLRKIALAEVVAHYGIDRNVQNPGVESANAARVKVLTDDPKPPKFTHKDFDAAHPRRYAEDPFVLRLLQQAIFKNGQDIGPQFRAAFDPLPFTVLALLLTVVEFSLDAWESGSLNTKLEFRAKDYREQYSVHLAELQEWEKSNPEAVLKMRRRMFRRVLELGKITLDGAQGYKVPDHQRERMKAAMEDRTGDTDSD